MISSDEAKRIASGWVSEYSVDPGVASIERQRSYFFVLDKLIYNHPSDALVIFESVADLDLSAWASEGLAAGPIREFLLIYGEKFAAELDAIGRRKPSFSELRSLAVEGLHPSHRP